MVDDEPDVVDLAVPAANPWAEYEARKRQFRRERPDASPDEYEAFIRQTLQELDL